MPKMYLLLDNYYIIINEIMNFIAYSACLNIFCTLIGALKNILLY
jgi:hypothetical protein